MFIFELNMYIVPIYYYHYTTIIIIIIIVSNTIGIVCYNTF